MRGLRRGQLRPISDSLCGVSPQDGAQIGDLTGVFLAPHLLQTRCPTTEGTGMRCGNPSDKGGMNRCHDFRCALSLENKSGGR